MRKKTSKGVAILGTGSGVGKSMITTALCRIISNNGFKVAPFKSSNISNNSGITADGLEISRAQITQAEAARTLARVEMNPVLLKPSDNNGYQTIISGEMVASNNEDFFSAACEAIDRLRKDYDFLVIEGSGSCAEINLMADDPSNFKIADYVDFPVILVADIYRGGVFAQIVGTFECLTEDMRDRVIGIIINRFNGDLKLIEEGIKWIEKRTGKKVLGVIPWSEEVRIPGEDILDIDNLRKEKRLMNKKNSIAVIGLPNISNFTDFEPLNRVNGLNVCLVETDGDLSAFKAVILPGSKNTISDLKWLAKTGLRGSLLNYANKGGNILGVCGGYQMLGEWVCDPERIEGNEVEMKGLSLLPVKTVLGKKKVLSRTKFIWGKTEGWGYEIHLGQTQKIKGKSMIKIISRNGVEAMKEDGFISEDKKIMGTYMHGFFDDSLILKKWLDSVGLSSLAVVGDEINARDKDYEYLAKLVEDSVDIESIEGFYPRRERYVRAS